MRSFLVHPYATAGDMGKLKRLALSSIAAERLWQKESALILKRRCVLPVVATFFIGWQRLQATAHKGVAGVATVATNSRFL